jgi:membrane-associated phospholipid phosphatase
MKILIHRKRPYRRLKNMRVVGAKAGGHSFPSGHTSQSFFLATLLIDYFRIDFPTALIFYGIAGMVGITRMYVGMHYPRDVIGGAVLGTAWGFIGAIINSHFF